jgi:capsule polysaccharide export protein KpsE/RkpR
VAKENIEKEKEKTKNEFITKSYQYTPIILLVLIIIFLVYGFYFTIIHSSIFTYVIEHVIFSWPPITALILIYLLISQKDTIE